MALNMQCYGCVTVWALFSYSSYAVSLHPLEPNTKVLMYIHWYMAEVAIELCGTTTMGSISFVHTFSNGMFSTQLGFLQQIDDTSSKLDLAPMHESCTSIKRLCEWVICICWPAIKVCSNVNWGS